MDINIIESELKSCLIGWRAYEKDLIKQGLAGPLKAMAVGWKVADLKSFKAVFSDLLDISEQAHVGSVNERFIGSFVLKEPLNSDEISVIKILQRRPGSEDPLGLDHIDFLAEDIAGAKKVLDTAKANYEEQSNDAHNWLSVRFGEVLEYEAKLVDHTVLDVAVKELKTAKISI